MHKENEKIKDIKDTKEEVEIAYVAQTFCKKCYGRGYIGREIHTNKYIPCKCINISYNNKVHIIILIF